MGVTGLDPRSLLKAEALDVPVQEVFDQELVLASGVFKQSVDAETITYWIQRNAQGENERRVPGAWDLGVDDWPEIRMKDLDRDSVSLDGLAMRARFEAKFLEFGTGNIDVADGVDRIFRYFAEKFETNAFNAYTSDRSIVDSSGEFDATFSEGTGGYADTGGHIVYRPDAGNEWDASGDVLQQAREMVTVMRTQGRIASLDGEVRASNNLVGYTDGLTLGIMHDALRTAGLSPQAGTIPGSITVPGIYGIEFRQADFAIENDGDMLIVDEGNRPMVGYYHEYRRLADLGFRTVGNESGFPLQVKDMDHDNGDASVMAASGSVYALRKPKYVMLATGLI